MQQEMRYVYEIYRQKSFSKAAQALFITQPALSIAISKLEASLGMPLFDRSTRPISLTPAGRIYLQTIEKTRALEQDLRHQLDDIRALRTGTITIGSSHFINACILPEILTRFNRKFPQVKLNLLEGSSHAMARMLEQREIDLTFSCDEAGIEPTIKIELSQMATASRLAEAGFAATFLSDRLVTSESHLHFYRLSHPESHRIFHALTSPKRYLPAAVKAFIECLK